MGLDYSETPFDTVTLSSEPFSNPVKSKDERMLLELPIDSVEELKFDFSINKVFKIHLEGDGYGISKPQSGESLMDRLWTPRGTYLFREKAAYLVDQALGIDLVPPTVIREVNDEISSVQRFIPNANTYYEVNYTNTLPDNFIDEHADQLRKLTVLDYLVNNGDRKTSNLLVSREGIHAIDNGMSFSEETIRHFKHPFCEMNTKEVFPFVDGLVNDPNKLSILESKLRQLLEKEEVDAFHNRLLYLHKLLQENETINMFDVRVYDPKPTENAQN